MLDIKLDDNASLFLALMILAFLPQIHLLFLILINDFVELINNLKVFINKNFHLNI